MSSEQRDEFQRIFSKNLICENIEVTKNQGYILSLENTVSEKRQRDFSLTPSPKPFMG